MTDIVTRAGKGSALTHNEADANFLDSSRRTRIDVRNVSGSTLAVGTVVKATGYNSGQDKVEVQPTTATTDVAFGIIQESLVNNTNGSVVNTGVVEALDTSAFTLGDKLYSDGAGGLTATKPASGDYQTCAFVLRSDVNNGRAYVEFTNPEDGDYVGTDTDNTWSGAQRGTVTTDNDGSFDMNVTNNFKCTPTVNFTLTFTNITAGQSGYILLVNTGGYTVSAHANTKVDANILATISTAGTYLLSYFSDGTNAYMTNSLAYT